MTRHVPPPSGEAATSRAILLDAARSWRAARDAGRPVQPCLFRTLCQTNCGVLAPVFDSLLTLCEAGLGRRFRVGAGSRLSQDERLLLGLVAGTKTRRARIACSKGAGAALDCAVCSTRIMMALTIPRPGSAAMQ